MASRVLSKMCLRQCAAAAPPTRTFLHLASRRSLSSAPVLDFLLPSIPAQSALRRARRPAAAAASPARSFTASSSRHSSTTAVYNPRKDDDGNDMTIEITPRAANRLSQIMAKDHNPHLALRITVESGGCHGFQYLMELTNVPPIDAATSQPVPAPASTPAGGQDGAAAAGEEGEMKLDEDDTLFEGEQGSKVVMDGPSLELLKGSKIDYTMELIGSQFKIVDNPLATSSCGCGTSFDVKF